MKSQCKIQLQRGPYRKDLFQHLHISLSTLNSSVNASDELFLTFPINDFKCCVPAGKQQLYYFQDLDSNHDLLVYCKQTLSPSGQCTRKINEGALV